MGRKPLRPMPIGKVPFVYLFNNLPILSGPVMTTQRIIDALLALPLILTAGFFAWSSLLAPDGSCGAVEPGLCFGLGWIFGIIVLPVSLLTTGILVFRLLLRARR